MVFDKQSVQISHKMDLDLIRGHKQIVLAGGCFWGIQAYLKSLPGVVKTKAVYVNGEGLDPSYEEVCTGFTGHAEAVYVVYDPKIINLDQILSHFFKIIDPKAVNRQGNDFGSQYRSGIYWIDPEDRPIINRVAGRIVYEVNGPLATEIKPLDNMSPAENYHQDYLDKNPDGYCHISFTNLSKGEQVLTSGFMEKSNRPLYNYQKKPDDILRRALSETAYDITQKGHTERPYSSPLDKENRPGIYVDVTSGQPLFSSLDKFDAGCGWPSFTRPLEDALIEECPDHAYGMRRTEVKAGLSDAHLGHVFTDGPLEQGGLRYCINGAALDFIPLEEMEERGYGYLVHLFIGHLTDEGGF